MPAVPTKVIQRRPSTCATVAWPDRSTWRTFWVPSDVMMPSSTVKPTGTEWMRAGRAEGRQHGEVAFGDEPGRIGGELRVHEGVRRGTLGRTSAWLAVSSCSTSSSGTPPSSRTVIQCFLFRW